MTGQSWVEVGVLSTRPGWSSPYPHLSEEETAGAHGLLHLRAQPHLSRGRTTPHCHRAPRCPSPPQPSPKPLAPETTRRPTSWGGAGTNGRLCTWGGATPTSL